MCAHALHRKSQEAGKRSKSWTTMERGPLHKKLLDIFEQKSFLSLS